MVLIVEKSWVFWYHLDVLWMIYLILEDMLLSHQHFAFVYHRYYILQFFVCNSVYFMFNASKASLFFLDRCICCIFNTLSKLTSLSFITIWCVISFFTIILNIYIKIICFYWYYKAHPNKTRISIFYQYLKLNDRYVLVYLHLFSILIFQISEIIRYMSNSTEGASKFIFFSFVTKFIFLCFLLFWCILRNIKLFKILDIPSPNIVLELVP